MSYQLGNITLPNPQEFNRAYLKTSTRLKMLDGTTKEDITNIKEVFTLVFRRLTKAQSDLIIGVYNAEEVVNFSVSESNLTINSTPVLVDCNGRSYMKGGEYRSDLTLTLEEVQ